MIHSPFPGMDPYLETPSIWPDVHITLMSIVGEQLTPLLAPKYLAELETQVVIDRLDDNVQVALPDVSVTTPDVSAGAPSAVAVAAPAPVRVRVLPDVPTRLVLVYILQRETARLVAVIESLSPVNKRRGKGREEYLEKRRTFLTSPVHLIEIDLLRSYPRMPFDDPLPSAHYIVMVCKAGERPLSSVWPISVRQPLPAIPIPLLHPDPPVPLDLGRPYPATQATHGRVHHRPGAGHRAPAGYAAGEWQPAAGRLSRPCQNARRQKPRSQPGIGVPPDSIHPDLPRVLLSAAPAGVFDPRRPPCLTAAWPRPEL